LTFHYGKDVLLNPAVAAIFICYKFKLYCYVNLYIGSIAVITIVLPSPKLHQLQHFAVSAVETNLQLGIHT